MNRMWNGGKSIGDQFTEIRYTGITAISPVGEGRGIKVTIHRRSGPPVVLAAKGGAARRLHRALTEQHHRQVNATG